jgi:RNA polymerase sigma factor (sigma-70 family)
MAANRLARVVRHLQEAAARHDAGAEPDGDLLGRFVRARDEAAFAALVRRHGPLVLGVCRRVLRNYHDAEDAFQATFLVLARRAASLRSPEALGGWLYGVAYRAASEVRRAAARRRAKEARAVPRTETPDDLGAVLDQELAGLPGPYRAAVVLSDLEGKTRQEVARELGCAEGTVASRVARGRALLARRLARRGLAPSAGALAAVARESASAGVPAALVDVTGKAAAATAAGPAAAGLVSAPVAAVAEGVLRAMFLNRLKAIVGAVLLLAVLAGGTGLVLSASQAGDPKGPAAGAPAPKKGPKGTVRETTAAIVVGAYETNEAYADEHFTGKRLRVSGFMISVKRGGGPLVGDPAYVLTLSPQPGPSLPYLTFEFPVGARKQLAPLQQGDQVVVEGRCQGTAPVGLNKAGETTFLVRFVDSRVVGVGVTDPPPDAGAGGPRPAPKKRGGPPGN